MTGNLLGASKFNNRSEHAAQQLKLNRGSQQVAASKMGYVPFQAGMTR
jgi:hypothetical protein